MKMDRPHFLSQAAKKTIFLKFIGRGPFKLSKKYPAAKHYTDIYRLVLLLTHLSFRLTVPLWEQCRELFHLSLFHLSIRSPPKMFSLLILISTICSQFS
jgi:hypothetical protein